MREVAALHEYAHHVTWHTAGVTGHGQQFQQVYPGCLNMRVGPGGGRSSCGRGCRLISRPVAPDRPAGWRSKVQPSLPLCTAMVPLRFCTTRWLIVRPRPTPLFPGYEHWCPPSGVEDAAVVRYPAALIAHGQSRVVPVVQRTPPRTRRAGCRRALTMRLSRRGPVPSCPLHDDRAVGGPFEGDAGAGGPAAGCPRRGRRRGRRDPRLAEPYGWPAPAAATWSWTCLDDEAQRVDLPQHPGRVVPGEAVLEGPVSTRIRASGCAGRGRPSHAINSERRPIARSRCCSAVCACRWATRPPTSAPKPTAIGGLPTGPRRSRRPGRV